MSASRPLADIRDTESRDNAFDVGFPLVSGLSVPTLLMSAFDPKQSLALPDEVEQLSMTTLRDKLVKIGAKVVWHDRYVTFQMAEVAVPRDLFQEIPRLIDALRPRPPIRC